MPHISMRVPWHDNDWNGHICSSPDCNTFCKLLPQIASARKPCTSEMSGCDWAASSRYHRPPCAPENGGFMNERAYTRTFTHRYVNCSKRHASLLPTDIEIPPYTAFGIPFRYLSLSSQNEISERHPEFSPVEKATEFNSSWLFGAARQFDILEWFRRNIIPRKSLCVFYCKGGNPVDDDSRRMIVGIGDIDTVMPINHYNSTSADTYPMWEIMFGHTIRRDLSKSEGFLLPYRQYLELDESYILKQTGLSRDEALDEITLNVDKLSECNRAFWELSYGCELVSDRTMLSILQAARYAVEAVIRHKLVGGNWQNQLKWIDSAIGRVKSQITPFPAFAEALRAISVNYPYLVEQDIRTAGCGTKDNPWDYFEQMLAMPVAEPAPVYASELPTYRQTWRNLSDKSKRVLQLLSRFEIPTWLIEDWLNRTDQHDLLIENPYILSEKSMINEDGVVTTGTIDLGVIADPEIQGAHQPQKPSVVETPIDQRRLRSLAVESLRRALVDGDTLLSISETEDCIRERLTETQTSLAKGTLMTLQPFFSDIITYLPADKPTAIQLKKYHLWEKKLSKILSQRAERDVSNPVEEDWESVARSSRHYNPNNERSVSATRQQAEALKMMACKRLSVLTGGAGTGKTTVVRMFLGNETIRRGGVLLLAPTGKARVRLSDMAPGIDARTVAQFLIAHKRFDPDRMVAVETKGAPKFSAAATVIIDECSMLTTRDMYVLMDAIDQASVKRIILIGDPYQLPPIGAGRPFSDLCNFLRRDGQKPNLKNAITVLTNVVRTIGGRDSDALTLASWFGDGKPHKDADAVFDKIASGKLDNDLRVLFWNDGEDLNSCLVQALSEEFGCSTEQTGAELRRSLGLNELDGLANDTSPLERIQILTPVLNPVWGSLQLNAFLQNLSQTPEDGETVEILTQKIHSHDKVILRKNERHTGYPSGDKIQLSNGQIGYVESVRKDYANVVFAGAGSDRFGYKKMTGEDSEAMIELAYAITIHKSQGSDFDTVVIVLPRSGRILSRELIYTALTRARKRVVLMLQDDIGWFRALSAPERSILAHRNTNMFAISVREQRKDIPYAEGLIHRTKPDADGNVIYVRSKSEVIIANELISAGLRFEYERKYNDGDRLCIPDFTFVTDWGDRIIWEHLGMLTVPEYREAWERKRKYYLDMGFVEGETLFTTRDHPDGSIDTNEVLDVIGQIKELTD